MKDVSENDGRTVLFVSHNMDSIAHLCNRGILLTDGQIGKIGNIEDVINGYLKTYEQLEGEKIFQEDEWPGNEYARLISVKVYTDVNSQFFDLSDNVFIEVKYLDSNNDNKNTAIIHIKDIKGNTIFASNEFNNDNWEAFHKGDTSIITATCKIPGEFLAEGKYSVLAAVGSYSPNIVHAIVDEVVGFVVADKGTSKAAKRNTPGSWPGIVRPYLDWNIKKETYAQ